MNFMKGLRARNLRLALLAARPAPDERILDLACGEGELTLRLAERSREVVGIDDRPFLGEAEERMIASPRVCFLQTSLEGLPFEDETFDRIVSSNAWHRLKDKEELLYEALRVLKPEGEMILTDACFDLLPFGRLWAGARGHRVEGFGEVRVFFERYFPSVRARRYLWGGMMIRAGKGLDVRR